MITKAQFVRINDSVAFGRRLDNKIIFDSQTSETETEAYDKSVKEAFELLGNEKAGEVIPKKVGVICHQLSMLPQKDLNTGMGSLAGGMSIVDFFNKTIGADHITDGPAGRTKNPPYRSKYPSDASHRSLYTTTMFSLNPLYIDLYQLTGKYAQETGDKKYCGILDDAEFSRIVEGNRKTPPAKKNGIDYPKNRTNYSYAYEEYNNAFNHAYKNFKAKLGRINAGEKLEDAEAVKALEARFKAFKDDPKNKYWLNNDALFEALSIEHKGDWGDKNDYYPIWNSDLDKELFGRFKGTDQATARINEIQSRYAKEIDLYKFCQFVASEQKKEAKDKAAKIGVEIYADLPSAPSDRDIWAHPEIFLKDKLMGVPPDYFSKLGQAWEFRVS